MLGTLTGDSNMYTIALFSVRCSKVTLITWSKRSKVIFRAIMRAHAQARHGSQQPMKLRDFHKYDTIDIACSKKVTLCQSSKKKGRRLLQTTQSTNSMRSTLDFCLWGSHTLSVV